MRYLVTGATGFLGKRVTRLLVAEGHEVTALVRHPDRAQDLAALGVRLCEGDVTLKESVRPAMAGADGVFHIASWCKADAREAAAAEPVNVGGTHNVLTLMKELGIPKGVYTSTLAVYGDTRGRTVDERHHHEGPWPNEADRTRGRAYHQVAEPLMRAGLPLVTLLPGLIYGPGDPGPLRALFTQYLRGKISVLPAGTSYCWSHVDGAARAHLAAMEKGSPGEAYIVAGAPHTLRQVFQIAEGITGIPAPRFHSSPGMLRALGAVKGVVGRLRRAPEDETAEWLRAAAGATFLGSNKKAGRALGFHERPLEDGLRETLMEEMRALGMTPRG